MLGFSKADSANSWIDEAGGGPEEGLQRLDLLQSRDTIKLIGLHYSINSLASNRLQTRTQLPQRS